MTDAESTQRVRYRQDGDVAVITLDDGKVNALSPGMIAAINVAIDRAEQAAKAIVLTGRDGLLSAGFDLKVMRSGGLAALRMIRGGFELAIRLLDCALPVIVACPGHAIAMGAFLVLSGDLRIGVAGDFKYQANEVAIGMPVPRTAIELCRQRLNPAAFQRAVILSAPFGPTEAMAAGFLDHVVDTPEALLPAALEAARAAAQLDARAHTVTKRRLRADGQRRLRRLVNTDIREMSVIGLRMLVKSRLGR